jgi:hypothetical protein
MPDRKPRLRLTKVKVDGNIRTVISPVDSTEIVWTCWLVGGKVVHVMGNYCGYRSVCGTGSRRWITAWGIPDWAKERMCYRCMYHIAAEIIRKETGKWAQPWPMYRKPGTKAHTLSDNAAAPLVGGCAYL